MTTKRRGKRKWKKLLPAIRSIVVVGTFMVLRRAPSIEISRRESRSVIVPLWRVVVNRASLSSFPFGFEGAPSNRNQATSSINLQFRGRICPLRRGREGKCLYLFPPVSIHAIYRHRSISEKAKSAMASIINRHHSSNLVYYNETLDCNVDKGQKVAFLLFFIV